MNALTRSADHLQLLDGATPWRWRGTLDWPLAGRLRNEGPDVVKAVIADRKSVGANIISCGAMLGWWPNLNPTDPQWWNLWRPLAQLALDQDMRLCIMVFCDTALYPVDALAHWERFYTQLGDFPNIVLAGVNQPGHEGQDPNLPLTQLETKSVAGFPRILFARDNPNESGNPTLPVGDLAFYCCSRETSKFFNIGPSLEQIVNGWPDDLKDWAGTHEASVLWESWHAKSGDPSCDPGLWRQIARSLCFKGVIGGNFYSDQCSQAALLTGIERACAIEFLGNIPTD